MSIAAGTRLGRHEIRSNLGEGGMGEVYLADDLQLNEPGEEPQPCFRFREEQLPLAIF